MRFPSCSGFYTICPGSDKLGVENLLKLTLFLWELCKQTQTILFLMLMTNISLAFDQIHIFVLSVQVLVHVATCREYWLYIQLLIAAPL